jgi:hypothetical protein
MNPPGYARGVLADRRPETRRRVTRLPSRHRPRALPAAGTARHLALITVLLASGTGPAAATGNTEGRVILADLQRFLLTYSGVFALIALTAAVAAGLIATDRLVITPAGRVTFQAVHRALSLAAVGFLATHVLLEILAHRSHAIDAVVPFLASGRTLYLGLGTLASDLILLIALTSVVRGRFASRWTGAWRGVHVTAYLGWPLAILHGLLAGRTAKPYVDWSYGACVAAVAVALVVRLVVPPRIHRGALPDPAPDRPGPGLPASLFPGHHPGAWLTAPPPLALPGESHDPGGTQYGVVYGVVDDGVPPEQS